MAENIVYIVTLLQEAVDHILAVERAFRRNRLNTVPSGLGMIFE